ncbi:PaaI family thioesterase [Caldimonas tepidiphila]|uniref:PaaI family thioesterase n=1 Tax=Caldimonas tepidiphila TaxID=2315841 RepID=UPI000E5A8441|nr:PaaI family thioesterase [Caldimonas tepidiphila]
MLSPAPIPDGFEPAFVDTDTFIGLCGPLYVRERDDGPPVLAMRIADKHLNLRGIAHGGLLATLADTALGYVLNRARGAQLSLVTASLTTDFAEAARLGDWVEAYVDIQRVGSRMAFANAYLHVGERRILRASGVFAAVTPLPQGSGTDG